MRSETKFVDETHGSTHDTPIRALEAERLKTTGDMTIIRLKIWDGDEWETVYTKVSEKQITLDHVLLDVATDNYER